MLLALVLPAALAADASKPHLHQGLIPRLELEGRPDVRLSVNDLEAIEKGRLWVRSAEEGGVGRAIGVRDVAAPMDVVFGQISDLATYVGKVPMLTSLSTYRREEVAPVTKAWARYLVKVVPGYSFEYFLEHQMSEQKGVVLFFLDYSRLSDVNDMQGKWFLEPHPTKAGWTRLYYQCELKFWGFVPRFIKTMLTGQGVATATAWVRKESERRAPAPAPRAFALAVGAPRTAAWATAAVLRAERAAVAEPGRQSASVYSAACLALAVVVTAARSRRRWRASLRSRVRSSLRAPPA